MNVGVRSSPIHGRGVFVRESIEKDDWQYVYGKIRTLLPGDPLERYSVEWYNDKSYVPYAPWCCCNHSDDPNCEIVEQDSDMLVIIALRDIEFDEEITIDYGFTPE